MRLRFLFCLFLFFFLQDDFEAFTEITRTLHKIIGGGDRSTRTRAHAQALAHVQRVSPENRAEGPRQGQS